MIESVIIVSEKEMEDFANEVEAASQEDGYKLVGNLVVTYLPNENSVLYSQLMIKE